MIEQDEDDRDGSEPFQVRAKTARGVFGLDDPAANVGSPSRRFPLATKRSSVASGAV